MIKSKINKLLNVLLPTIIGIELIVLVVMMSPTSPAEIWANINNTVFYSNNWFWIVSSKKNSYE